MGYYFLDTQYVVLEQNPGAGLPRKLTSAEYDHGPGRLGHQVREYLHATHSLER